MGQVLGFPGVDPEDAAVGARLKRWREARGMAVEDLARLMDMTPEEERRVEAGRAHLDGVRQGAATRALRLPIWALASDRRAH